MGISRGTEHTIATTAAYGTGYGYGSTAYGGYGAPVTTAYAKSGIAAHYVGHPLADLIPLETSKQAVREKLGLPRAAPVFALLPGSRKGELERMVRQYSNFDYVPCVSGHDVQKGHAAGRADQVAMTDTGSLKGWRVFLCGHPDMVRSAKKRAFLAGASMKEIHADPFVINPPPLAAFN